MEEIFKKIENNENYSVSNLGRVRDDITGRFLKGTLHNKGYTQISLDGKHYLIHRLVAIAFILNPDNKSCIDHINSIKIDNRIDNIRWATGTENNQNQKIRKDNTSGTKGVYWNKRDKKWIAQIYIDKKKVNLGSFDNIEDAIKARQEKAKEIFGDFLNECEKKNE